MSDVQQLKLVPMWPEPALAIMYRTLMRQASAKAAARAHRVALERADALELGLRHVAQLAARARSDRGFHQAVTSGSDGLAALDQPLGELQVLRVVDREALLALGEEGHDALAGDRRRRLSTRVQAISRLEFCT